MPNPTPPQNNMMQELWAMVMDLIEQLIAMILELLGTEQPEE
jgi:hypothetical protein